MLASSENRDMKARLLHYRGIHMLDEKKPAEAEALLAPAQAAYTELVPAEALTRKPAPKPVRNHFDINARITTGTSFKLLGDDPTMQPLLLGLIEVLRYRAIAMRDLGRPADADTLTNFAARVAAANDLGRPSVFARVFRTAGVTAAGDQNRAARSPISAARTMTSRSRLPGTKPAAEAALIRAGVLMRAGKIRRGAVGSAAARSASWWPSTPGLRRISWRRAWTLTPAAGRSVPDRPTTRKCFSRRRSRKAPSPATRSRRRARRLTENARDPQIGAALRKRDDLQA